MSEPPAQLARLGNPAAEHVRCGQADDRWPSRRSAQLAGTLGDVAVTIVRAMTVADEQWNGLDSETPNAARMYDYLLGGAANFAADRELVRQIERSHPELRRLAVVNRAFLRRVVRHLVANTGVRQFLDLGSGVPTVGHVHEIAHQSDPAARVVYVDSEPVACTYSRQVLEGVPGTAMIEADVRDTDRVLSQVKGLLDLEQPVGVLMFALLPFVVEDRQATELVSAYRDRTVPGSYLAISHGVVDDAPDVADLADQYEPSSQHWKPRRRDQVVGLFDGYDLVEPGVVRLVDWRPDDDSDDPANPDPADRIMIGGLGQRR
jgi:hypothetical protein